jgi:AraC-like DNA-binding protein
MKIEISTKDTKIIEAIGGLWGVSNHSNGFEKRLEYPGEIGKGSMRQFELRPGLKLEIYDFQPHENLSESFDMEYSLLRFSFFLSGSGNLEWGATHRREQINDFVGRSAICFYPEVRGIMRLSGGQRLLQIVIGISPLLLNTFLRDEFDRIPSNLRGIAEGSNGDGYYHPGTMSPSMQTSVHEILSCPYHGSIKRMYMESKAMELITHQLAHVVFPETSLKKSSVLRPDDIERIHHAREIISRDLENPPTLFELARLVGLTHTKLNRGFREIYGTTVFGYLHKIRLERARLLLEEQRMNVTEAAFTVGYNSLPSFSTAFSKHFGLKPMTCIKNSLHTCLP